MHRVANRPISAFVGIGVVDRHPPETWEGSSTIGVTGVVEGADGRGGADTPEQVGVVR